jgi:hypothetical protein
LAEIPQSTLNQKIEPVAPAWYLEFRDMVFSCKFKFILIGLLTCVSYHALGVTTLTFKQHGLIQTSKNTEVMIRAIFQPPYYKSDTLVNGQIVLSSLRGKNKNLSIHLDHKKKTYSELNLEAAFQIPEPKKEDAGKGTKSIRFKTDSKERTSKKWKCRVEFMDLNGKRYRDICFSPVASLQLPAEVAKLVASVGFMSHSPHSAIITGPAIIIWQRTYLNAVAVSEIMLDSLETNSSTLKPEFFQPPTGYKKSSASSEPPAAD